MRIIGNKESDGLLNDSVGLYDSRVDLVVVLDHHKMFYVVGKSGGKKRNTFRRELGQRCGTPAFTTSLHITHKFSPNKSDI